MARVEFSVVIADIGSAPALTHGSGPITAGYVLLMAFAGPILTRTLRRHPEEMSPSCAEPLLR